MPDARRIALATLILLPLSARATPVLDDPYANDPALRRLVDDMHGEATAVDLGRLYYRKRWEELQTEALYSIAPRGTWNESHPAWAPARQVLADALRRETVGWLDKNRDEVRLILNDRTMRLLDAEERVAATAFFESTGGRVWQARRDAVLHEKAYGLPFVIETDSLAQVIAADAKAQALLLALPEDGDGKVVYEFFESPAGKKILKMQIEEWAETLPNVWGNELDAIAQKKMSELAVAVRAAVPNVPPASDKAYLGTVAMRPDRGFIVVVEDNRNLQRMGSYSLEFAPSDPLWADIAAAVPRIEPGEKRAIYRDRDGRLGDKP